MTYGSDLYASIQCSFLTRTTDSDVHFNHTTYLVDFIKYGLGFTTRQLHVEQLRAPNELVEIDAAVIVDIDQVELLP